ncbi:hypothetical protein Tco_1332865 [Tanacetum coccineum]
MGIHDFLCLPEWTGSEVQEEPHHDIRPTIQRLPFYCTPAAIAAAILDPTLEDLSAGTPSVKVMAKVKASKRQKASTFDDDDDDDDTCVEIPLITPIHSTATIHTKGNQSRSSTPSAAEGPSTRDSQGKVIMSDVADASSRGADHSRTSVGPAPTFRDISRDAIHRDFFPFTPGPYYATYPVDGVVAGSYEFPTLGEMVRIEALTDDQLAAKMSVLHCLMMGLEEKSYAYQGLESQVSGFKKQVAEHNDKLSSFDASFVKSKAKGKERKKKIKSLSKNLDHLTTEVSRLSSALNQATVLEAERDAEIFRLRAFPSEFASLFQSGFQSLVWKFLASDEFSRVQGELLSLADSAGFECGLSMDQTPEEFVVTVRISPPLTKESTVTPVSSSLEFVSNVIPSSSAVVVVEQPSIEQNK